MYPLFIQRPFEVSTSRLGPVYQGTFWTENANFFFLYGYPFLLHEKVKTHENIFTSKTLSKVETFENAIKETLCKSRVNAENLNAENAKAETIFYLA